MAKEKDKKEGLQKGLLATRGVDVPIEAKVIQEKGEVEKLIELAVNKNADVEVLERLMKLRDRYKQEWARQRFYRAYAQMQAVLPEITLDQVVYNKDGKTVRYRYASLDNIIRTIKPTLQRYGFSYMFKTRKKENAVEVTCVLMHEDGHSEETSFEAPIDPASYMALIQKFGSALTYAKRYTLVSLLGLTAEVDDDANVFTEEAEEYDKVYQKAHELGLLQYSNVRKTLDQARQEGRPAETMLKWLDKVVESMKNGKDQFTEKHLPSKEEQ